MAVWSTLLKKHSTKIRDVPIPFFPFRYRFQYLGSGYRPIRSSDPIPGYVSGYTALCTNTPVWIDTIILWCTSPYKYIHIVTMLLRYVCLVHAAVLSVQIQVCGVKRRILQSKSSCTSDRKIEIFPWLSNIYRWRIYLWNVSNAFRKRAHSSNSASLSEHTQPFCQSRSKIYHCLYT